MQERSCEGRRIGPVNLSTRSGAILSKDPLACKNKHIRVVAAFYPCSFPGFCELFCGLDIKGYPTPLKLLDPVQSRLFIDVIQTHGVTRLSSRQHNRIAKRTKQLDVPISHPGGEMLGNFGADDNVGAPHVRGERVVLQVELDHRQLSRMADSQCSLGKFKSEYVDFMVLLRISYWTNGPAGPV